MPRRTPDGPQEVTEHSKDSKPYDPELTPVKPKAETVRPKEPGAEILESMQERVSTYEDGSVIERLGASGGTEKWTVNSIDDRGTIFLTSESGKRAMMHESEVALEERAATFAPQLDAAWGKTIDTVAEMTDEDDVVETAAMLKDLRGDILLLAAERLAANPEADPARALLGAVYDVQKRVEAEKKAAHKERTERAEIQAAKEYLGFSPADANALADAENMLGTLRFGSYEPSVVDRGAPFVEHTKTLSSPQLENIATARATVAEIAVLDPDLRDDILGNIPDIISDTRSASEIDAELKQVDDDLSFVEQQWRAHGKGDKNSAEADVYLKRTHSLREREKSLMAERRMALAQSNEVTAPLPEPEDESEEVALKLPRRRTTPRARTINKDEGRGPAAEAPVGFVTVPPLKDFERDSQRNQEFVKKSRGSVDAIDRQRKLQERLAAIRENKPVEEPYRAPEKIEPPSFSERPITPTRKNREMNEAAWMAEGESNKDLRTNYEKTPKINPPWYRKFTEDFGGSQDFQSMYADARARTKEVKFTLEDLKHSNFVTRWFYKRQMDKAVKEMVRQDAKKMRRGSLQA